MAQTSTQKKFKKNMARIERDMKKNKTEKIYSYIQDRYISSYYENAEGNPYKRIKKLNIFKYTFRGCSKSVG
jgi:hypothetical protein